jgi:CelD/BcsL family acetyltransferase involved in cellulose biosynthesis
MIQLLERLVVAVEKGGTVILDGQKVGDALVAGSYRMQ